MTEGNKEGIDQISEMFFDEVLMDGKGTVDFNALKDSQWIRDSQAEMVDGNLAFMKAIITDPTAMGILTVSSHFNLVFPVLPHVMLLSPCS